MSLLSLLKVVCDQNLHTLGYAGLFAVVLSIILYRWQGTSRYTGPLPPGPELGWKPSSP